MCVHVYVFITCVRVMVLGLEAVSGRDGQDVEKVRVKSAHKAKIERERERERRRWCAN